MEKNTSLKGKVGKDCVLIFLHIGKTAGSTLHRILEEQYSDTGHFFTVGGLENKDGKKFSTLTRKERDKIGVIRGHLNFGVHELIEKPAVYITMLRDPVDRIISTYYYLKRDKGHYLHDICRSDGWTLEDFVFYKPTEIMNGQTRVLAGVSDVYSFFKMGRESVPLGKCDDEILETAKRNLKKFAVVGLMERFDKTMILLKRSLGWETPPLYIKQNVSNDRLRKKEVSGEIIQFIEEHNKLDIALYRYATELFDEQIKQQDSSFEVESKYFKMFNKTYQEHHRLEFQVLQQEHQNLQQEYQKLLQTKAVVFANNLAKYPFLMKLASMGHSFAAKILSLLSGNKNVL